MAILAWSTVSTAFKLSLRSLHPVGLLLISSLAASIFLLIYRLISRIPSDISLTQNIRKSLVPALLNPMLYYLVLFEAYHRLRAQEAQALNYTWAIVLSVFSIILLKERFRLKDMIALGISFLGVLVISTKAKLWNLEFDDALGTFLAAFSSIIWASYWILNMRDQRPALVKLSYNFLLGTVLILLYVLSFRSPVFIDAAQPWAGILWGSYVGIFEMGLTFVLWMKALELSESTAKVSNLIFITPFISLLFIRFALGETIHIATILGMGLIIASNILQKS